MEFTIITAVMILVTSQTVHRVEYELRCETQLIACSYGTSHLYMLSNPVNLTFWPNICFTWPEPSAKYICLF